MTSIYRTDAYREFVSEYLAARDATRERPSPGALPRNPAVARVFVDAYSDDGPRGVASCGGVALRCDAAAGAFDAGVGVCDG